MTPEALNLIGEKEGWKLTTVVNAGTSVPYWMIFGTTLSDAAARKLVVDKAKQGSKAHITALRLVAVARTPSPPPRKKR